MCVCVCVRVCVCVCVGFVCRRYGVVADSRVSVEVLDRYCLFVTIREFVYDCSVIIMKHIVYVYAYTHETKRK